MGSTWKFDAKPSDPSIPAQRVRDDVMRTRELANNRDEITLSIMKSLNQLDVRSKEGRSLLICCYRVRAYVTVGALPTGYVESREPGFHCLRTARCLLRS